MTKALLSVALVPFAGLAFQPPALAQPGPQTAQTIPPVVEREQTTNRALLDGLLRRRIETSRVGDTKASRTAIAFIDERIAQLIKRGGR